MTEMICVDIETTGLNPNHDEIVEVSAIRFDDIGQILGIFHELCSPESGMIPAEAMAIHGITDAMVKGKPKYLEVKEKLAEFIGKRKVVGHNIDEFDLKFLKIVPTETEDTLKMCRAIWPAKNRLGEACKRLNIKFDKKEAHTSTYDTEKCIELYLTLKAMNKQSDQQSIFDGKLAPTQAYSFSRINSFMTCPFKWRQAYLLKNKEPDHAYLMVGKIVHMICQLSAMWSYTETFGNRFSVYAFKKYDSKLDPALIDLVKREALKGTIYLPKEPDKITIKHIGMYLYRNTRYIDRFFGITIEDLMLAMPTSHPDMELFVQQPEKTVYDTKIVPTAIASMRCSDPEIITEAKYLADMFYRQRSFFMMNGEVALVEQRLAFDKNWKIVDDWLSDKVYMRFIVDLLEATNDGYVTITDYKTGRKMIDEKELQNDFQMKCYVLAVMKFLPGTKLLRVCQHYIRFGKTISIEIKNPQEYADAAEQWINESINTIEAEMLRPQDQSFLPKRNEFCGSCYLAESNTCPLFNVKYINDITDVANFQVKTLDDLRKAWKKIEVNAAEIKNLTAKAKAFVKQCEGRVMIDETAKLDFWAKKEKKVDLLEAARILLEKGVELAKFLDYASISNTEFEKFLEKNKISLTPEELSKIVEEKTRVEFDALTDKEVGDKYYNLTGSTTPS